MHMEDNYPDFIIPLARAVASGDVERGIALCGSGIGASIAANKIPGVRAGLIHDTFSAPSIPGMHAYASARLQSFHIRLA